MGKKLLHLLLFLLITAACVGITLFIGGNQFDVMIYNFVFMGIMVVLYMAGMFGGMFRMDDVGSALGRGTEEITDIFKLPGKAKASDLAAIDGCFDNRFLDKKLREFTDDISKTQEGIGDIEDYINDDELNIHVHKRLLEMIPDIFTSLGILGTFVGLVWGLKDFNTTDLNNISGSVSALLDGIKVAFLTSIYGIAFSIVYSYGLRSENSTMSERLQVFLNRFHSYVMPNAENESRNLLVASTKVQTDAMQQMAEQFSVQLADSFEQVITPTFRKMNTSMDRMIDSVTQVQTEAVHEILDVFMKEMRSSFRLQFDDFNKALNQLTQTMKETTDYTSTLYQNMSRQMSDSYAQQEQALKESVTQMGNLQTRFMSTASRITQDNQNIQKQQQEDYQHVLDYMKDAEQSAAKFWVACNQTMKRYVEAATAGMENVNAASEAGIRVQEENKRIIEQYSSSMKEFTDYQKRTYQLMQQVQRLLTDITAAGNTRNVQLTSGRSETLAQQESLRRIQRLLEEQSNEQVQLLQEIAQSTNDLSKAAQKGRFGLFK